jgi:hypothetical protein
MVDAKLEALVMYEVEGNLWKRGREGGRGSYRIHECRGEVRLPRNTKPRSKNWKGYDDGAVWFPG